MPALSIGDDVYDVKKTLDTPAIGFAVFEVTKREADSDTYYVTLNGSFSRCTCKDYEIRHHKDRSECKHIRQLKEYQMDTATKTKPAVGQVLPEASPTHLPATTNGTQAPSHQNSPGPGPAAIEPFAPTDITGHPHLARALSEAQTRCPAVGKSGWNDHFKYAYPRAQDILAAWGKAKEGSGLSLVGTCPKLAVMGTGNLAIYALKRSFVLLHSSGDWIALGEVEWPVLPDKGRPLDKAFAGAITSSLAYIVSGLLQMPYTDPSDDVGGDGGSGEQPQRQTQQPTQEQPRPAQQPPPVQTVSAPPQEEIIRPDAAQAKRITRLAEQLKIHPSDFFARLQQKYGVDSISLLTLLQANEIENALRDRANPVSQGQGGK